MLNTIAITLAAIMIPTSPVNAIMPESTLSICEPTAYIQQERTATGIIHTPNGSEVNVLYPSDEVTDSTLDFYTHYFDGSGGGYSGDYTNINGETVTLKDKNIRRIGDPTTRYNGIAFAFYMYWEIDYPLDYERVACEIRDISPYLNDHSYEIVDEPKANDIVCYYSDEGILTAGVILEVAESEAGNPSGKEPFVKQLSKLKVLTKWDRFGVYEHRGDYSPYLSNFATEYVTTSVSVGVQYLRRHTHSYTQKYVADGDKYHKAYCKCGDYSVNPHIWIRGSNRQKYCEYCFYRTSGFPFLTDTLNLDYNDVDYKSLHKN